ncbi:MAG: hypothetical protein WKF37_10230 [Bryobacteraceae bacterium]
MAHRDGGLFHGSTIFDATSCWSPIEMMMSWAKSAARHRRSGPRSGHIEAAESLRENGGPTPPSTCRLRSGDLTPIFFGSALKNFGVAQLLDGLADFGPPNPAARPVQPTEQRLTGFVFKVQANTDPNHRDRIAFVRICSGKLVRGMKVTNTLSKV